MLQLWILITFYNTRSNPNTLWRKILPKVSSHIYKDASFFLFFLLFISFLGHQSCFFSVYWSFLTNSFLSCFLNYICQSQGKVAYLYKESHVHNQCRNDTTNEPKNSISNSGRTNVNINLQKRWSLSSYNDLSKSNYVIFNMGQHRCYMEHLSKW